MKTAAVICEFNPFHNGHDHLLKSLKSKYGFERIICVMSGNYVQRGEPAVLDKALRTEAALISGADLVLELPAEFSCSSAGDFARGAVSVILKTGICAHLCFGVEPGTDLAFLNSVREKEKLTDQISEYIKTGHSYPEALSLSAETNRIQPNSRLGIEYLNAIDYFDAANRLSPVLIERIGDGYNTDVPNDLRYTSATALRNMILHGKTKEAEKWMPYSLSRADICSADMLTDLLNDRLLRESGFESYLDVSREISDRLLKIRYSPMLFTERIEYLWTKQYTRSRISRALLHIVLGIKKERISIMKNNGYVNYFRVLGYRTESNLLNEIKRNSTDPVYVKNSRFYEAQPEALYYDQIWHNITGTGTELTRSPVIF